MVNGEVGPPVHEEEQGMRRRGVRWVGGVVALLAAVSMAGCSSGAGTTSTAAGGSAGATAPAAAGGATQATQPAPAPAAPSTPAGAGAGAGGPITACSMIDLATASAWLGGPAKQLSVPGVPETAVEKLDGCSYTTSGGSLGYAVNRHGDGSASVFVEGAKAQMAKMPAAKTFDVGLGDASLGFTMAAGAKTLARIEIVKGSTTIAVSTTWADEAKAVSIAKDAAAKLVAAVG